jgi:hypothetical protein
MRLEQPLIYSNPTSQSARYIVAICAALDASPPRHFPSQTGA